MLFIGIDKEDFQLVAHMADEKGDALEHFRVKKNPKGLNELLSSACLHEENPDEIICGIEGKSGLVVDFLLQHNITVIPVPPKLVDEFRNALFPSGAKDDDRDSEAICHIVRTLRTSLRPLILDVPLTRELKLLSRQRKALVATKVAIQNQLRSQLLDYYPSVLNVFGDLDTSVALAFLTDYPSPFEARALSKDEFSAFLKRNHYTHPSRAEEMYAALVAPARNEVERRSGFSLLPDSVTLRVCSQMVSALVEQLKLVRQQIKELEGKLASLIKEHSSFAIISSLPSVDVILIARLIGEIGDIEKYRNADALQGQAGTCPVTKRSGKRKSVIFRRGCCKPLRDTLYQFTFCTLKKVKWVREKYDSMKAEGKSLGAKRRGGAAFHSRAIRQLSDQWAEIIFAMLKKGQQYNENVYLSMRGLYKKAA